jgi:hypothetical protein
VISVGVSVDYLFCLGALPESGDGVFSYLTLFCLIEGGLMADEKKNNANLPSLVIDLTELSSFLVDLPPGGLQGFLTEKDDYKKAADELRRIDAETRDKLSISQDLAEIETIDAQLVLLDARQVEVLKAAEVLRETRAKLINRRERKIGTVCTKVDTYVKDTNDKSVLATVAETNQYRTQIAQKSARSREKNKEAEETEEKK